MLFLAGKLTSNLDYARVDFYYHENRIYFGEITLCESSGYIKYFGENWDLKLGELWG